MKVAFDTDVFCKLGVCGLLDSTAGIFGARLSECGRLPALPFMLRRGALVRKYGVGQCAGLRALADAMPAVKALSGGWLDRLVEVEDIDAGEAQLFAAAAEGEFNLITGDKRALVGLTSIPQLAIALTGRVATLELILLRLAAVFDVRELRARVRPMLAHDTTIRICFADAAHDPVAALLSYARATAADVNPLIFWSLRHGVPL